MPIVDSPIIAFCVLAYLAMCLGIGVWAMRKTKTAADFFVAGRQLGLVVTVIAGVSSIMSGFGFVGGPGLVFESGVSSLHMCLVGGFSGAFAWLIVGKRMRLLAEVETVLTLPEAIELRYGGRAPRLAMSIAVLLGVIGYLGTQVMAIGLVLQAVLGVNLEMALLIGLGVLAFYTIAGGIIAGVYTDLFQGVLMIFAAAGIFYYVQKLTGGMAQMSEVFWDMDPEYISPWGQRGAVAALSWFFLFVVGNVGQPHGVITKSLMMRNIRDLKWAPLLAFAAGVFLPLLWMNMGLAMRYLVETGKQEPFATPDLAAPLLLLNHTPELLAGIVFAGLLAAIMSTADSFVNLGAAAIVRDIPAALHGKPPDKQLEGSRLVTGGLLVVSALFALYMDNLVALLGTFGWGTFAAAVVPSAVIGFNWKRASAEACVWSISVSVAMNFGLEMLARNDIYKLPYGMNVGALSLLVSLVLFVAISFATGDPEGKNLSPRLRAVMEA